VKFFTIHTFCYELDVEMKNFSHVHQENLVSRVLPLK